MNLNAYFQQEISELPEKEKLLSEACFQKLPIKLLTAEEVKFIKKTSTHVYFEMGKTQVSSIEGVFSLNNNLYLLDSAVVSDAQGSHSAGMPRLFKLNRRENFRFQLPKMLNVMVEFNKQKYEAYDVSSEGISFVVPSFGGKLNDKVKLKFTIKDNEYDVECEVKGIIPQPMGDVKVGVKFVKFQEGRQWQLTNSINALAIQFKK